MFELRNLVKLIGSGQPVFVCNKSGLGDQVLALQLRVRLQPKMGALFVQANASEVIGWQFGFPDQVVVITLAPDEEVNPAKLAALIQSRPKNAKFLLVGGNYASMKFNVLRFAKIIEFY